jgi:hypothetical protein
MDGCVGQRDSRVNGPASGARRGVFQTAIGKESVVNTRVPIVLDSLQCRKRGNGGLGAQIGKHNKEKAFTQARRKLCTAMFAVIRFLAREKLPGK